MSNKPFTGKATASVVRGGSHVYLRFTGALHKELLRRSIGWIEPAQGLLNRAQCQGALAGFNGSFNPEVSYKVQQKTLRGYSYVEFPAEKCGPLGRMPLGAFKVNISVHNGGGLVVWSADT